MSSSTPMYAKDDIRSRLASVAPAAQVDPSTPIKDAQWIAFREHEPTLVGAHGGRTWIARAANLVIAYSDAKTGEVLERPGQADEYTVLLTADSAPVRVTVAGESALLDEAALVIVPPGDSEIEVLADGPVIRVFSIFNQDLREAALNADAYAEPDLRAAPLEPWPDPVGGFRLRVHRLADTPIAEGRFGRIFRTTTVMVNFLAEEPGPRDPLKLSPHHHDDFEQISLALQGRFVHHIRYPWGPDSSRWREDEHREIGSPSICIIPPPTVHTTQGVGEHQQLVDIFAPPRVDFSESGWVLNAEEYPAR